MLYLSQIIGNKVTDSAEKMIGRLKDILIAPKTEVYSPLVFLLVKTKNGKDIYVPYSQVENFGVDRVGLKGLIENIKLEPPAGEHIYLVDEVLDQQIVDVHGARVVRVNDLKLGDFEEEMCVLGIDVSFKGLLRRLGLGWLDFFNIIKVKLIDWRKTQLMKKKVLRLNALSKDLVKLHPADLANIIEDLSVRRGSRVFLAMDADKAARVLEEVDPEIQKMLIHYLGVEKAAGIVSKMSVDEIADLLQLLPKNEAKDFLSFIKNGKMKKVEKLIQYGEDTAGGLMTTDFISGRPDWTVERMIEEIKKESSSLRSVLYVYVVDKNDKFLGSISLRRLLISEGARTLGELLKWLPSYSVLRPGFKIKDILKVMTKYNLYTAAVVDDEGKFIGMVTIDDVLRCLAPNA